MPQTGSSAASKKAKTMSPKRADLGSRVRDALKQSMVDHIARAGGISPSIVQGVAEGTYKPTPIEIERLEKGLGCFKNDK